MIANDTERAVVARQVDQLKADRDALAREGAPDTLATRVEVAGIEKMIARLQEEIDAYEGRNQRAATCDGVAEGRSKTGLSTPSR